MLLVVRPMVVVEVVAMVVVMVMVVMVVVFLVGVECMNQIFYRPFVRVLR